MAEVMVSYDGCDDIVVTKEVREVLFGSVPYRYGIYTTLEGKHAGEKTGTEKVRYVLVNELGQRVQNPYNMDEGKKVFKSDRGSIRICNMCGVPKLLSYDKHVSDFNKSGNLSDPFRRECRACESLKADPSLRYYRKGNGGGSHHYEKELQRKDEMDRRMYGSPICHYRIVFSGSALDVPAIYTGATEHISQRMYQHIRFSSNERVRELMDKHALLLERAGLSSMPLFGGQNFTGLVEEVKYEFNRVPCCCFGRAKELELKDWDTLQSEQSLKSITCLNIALPPGGFCTCRG